jgi:hypothetical protein
MYACVNPEQPGNHDPFLIHAKPLDRGSPDWRQAPNTAACINPGEVLRPGLSSRVKQGNALTALRIEGICGVALGQVAGGASQCQVIRVIVAIRDDVIDMHGLANHALAGAAVFAAVSRSLMNQPDSCSPG